MKKTNPQKLEYMKIREWEIFLIFYGLIFTAFGLGIFLKELVPNICSGLIFMCIGFLLLLIKCLFPLETTPY